MIKLRRLLLMLLGIALAFVITGFLLPGKVRLERSLLINASPSSIFEQVNTLKNWEKWSPWSKNITLMKIKYSGPESGKGARLTWDSPDKNINSGYLSILYSVPFDSLMVLMDYGANGKTAGKFVFTKVNDSTRVTWRIESNIGLNPISRWFGLFINRMVGPDIEGGLLQLAEIVEEKKQNIDGFEITGCEIPARVLLSIRDTASPGSLMPKLALMYGKISRFIKSRNLSPAGYPLAVYHNYSTTIFDIEACIPVASVVKTTDGISCVETVPQKTIMVQFYGAYKSISKAYEAIQKSLKDRNLHLAGSFWEEYINNPHQEADSNKWQVNIYFPVKE